jgi:hypothetical protein
MNGGLASGFVVAAFGVSLASAASVPYLLPIDRDFKFLAQAPDLQAYHLAAREALLGESSRGALEALVIPSFEREWAIRPRQDGGEYEVVCTTMQRQLWGEMHAAAARIDPSLGPASLTSALDGLPRHTWRYKAPITRTTAVLLEQVWDAMLAQAREPGDPPRCIDGTSYYIFMDRADEKAGCGRCPRRETPAGSLLEILEDLRKAAGGSGQHLMRQDMALARKAALLLWGPPARRSIR